MPFESQLPNFSCIFSSLPTPSRTPSGLTELEKHDAEKKKEELRSGGRGEVRLLAARCISLHLEDSKRCLVHYEPLTNPSHPDVS